MSDDRRSKMFAQQSGIFIGGHECVDLGLPSGILWAKCNVGASKEWQYGNYYQYGTGSTTYTAGSTAYYENMGQWEYYLPANRDTATVVMGNNFYSPKAAQIDELLNNTNRSEVSINGVNGMKFVNKTDSTKYIFIPYSGYYYTYPGYSDGTDITMRGTIGKIWSSERYGRTGTSYHLQCYGSSTSKSSINRDTGINVRGVHDAI